jgi:hypothetical protein
MAKMVDAIGFVKTSKEPEAQNLVSESEANNIPADAKA